MMYVTRLLLKNWRNFRDVDVAMGPRVFLIGPNASGKSNLLDVFRFLRDLAKPGGGLQKAVTDRGGISKIRCLAARQNPVIEIEVHLSESLERAPLWKYAIGISQESRGRRLPLLKYEKVWSGSKQIVARPTDDDKKDRERLTQTFLEQINSNQIFRDIADFFQSVLYLHLVPQLLRFPDTTAIASTAGDPFGRTFIERVVKTPEKSRQRRLDKIEKALKNIVPQLSRLTVSTDKMGIPHLEAKYEHWRPNAGLHREDQFSDGTLRLIGLLWSLLESDSLLLLEEPELSLHSEVVKRLPSIFHRVQRQKKRQVVLSTHSADLLSDAGIGGEEVLILTPGKNGTEVNSASDIQDIRAMLECGFSIADAALPQTKPTNVVQMTLFE